MRNRVRAAITVMLGPPIHDGDTTTWRVETPGQESLHVALCTTEPAGTPLVMIFNPAATDGKQVKEFWLRGQTDVALLLGELLAIAPART